jgi:hypothetical protein
MKFPFEEKRVNKIAIKTDWVRLDATLAHSFTGLPEDIEFSGYCSGVEGLQNLIEYLEVIKRELIRQNQSHDKRKTR